MTPSIKARVVRIAQQLPDEDGSGAAGGEQEVFVCGDGKRGDEALAGLKISAHGVGARVVGFDVAVARTEHDELFIAMGAAGVIGERKVVKGDRHQAGDIADHGRGAAGIPWLHSVADPEIPIAEDHGEGLAVRGVGGRVHALGGKGSGAELALRGDCSVGRDAPELCGVVFTGGCHVECAPGIRLHPEDDGVGGFEKLGVDPDDIAGCFGAP